MATALRLPKQKAALTYIFIHENRCVRYDTTVCSVTEKKLPVDFDHAAMRLVVGLQTVVELIAFERDSPVIFSLRFCLRRYIVKNVQGSCFDKPGRSILVGRKEHARRRARACVYLCQTYVGSKRTQTTIPTLPRRSDVPALRRPGCVSRG